MKLITELVNMEGINFLVEDVETDKGKKKNYYLQGIMAESEVKNRNGRIYPKNILEKAVGTYNKDFIQKKRALGTLEHDVGPSLCMDRVCHVLESLEMKDNVAYGRAKLLEELPLGKIAISLVKEGILLGMSSRCLGSVTDKGVVGDDLVMLSIDLVHAPSAPSAFVEAVLENRDYIIDNGKIVEVAVSNLQNKVDRKYNSTVVLQYMTEFMNDLKLGNKLLK
jgi:hypothetical protein